MGRNTLKIVKFLVHTPVFIDFKFHTWVILGRSTQAAMFKPLEPNLTCNPVFNKSKIVDLPFPSIPQM